MLFETALLPSGVSLKPFVQVSGYVGMWVCAHTLKTLQRTTDTCISPHEAKLSQPSQTFSSCFWSLLKVFHRENPCSGALESPCLNTAAPSRFGVTILAPWAKQNNLDSSTGVPGESGLTTLTQVPCFTQIKVGNFSHVFHYHLKWIFPTGKKVSVSTSWEEKRKAIFPKCTIKGFLFLFFLLTEHQDKGKYVVASRAILSGDL